METTYEHFKDFLTSEYSNAVTIGEEEINSLSEISEDSDIIFRLLIHAINEAEDGFWSNLEETLGEINYDAFLRQNQYQKIVTLLENLETRADVFKDLFDKWVNEIDMEGVKPKQDFKSLIESGDLFLNFNYTRTLEDVYNVDEEAVLHIHGEAGNQVEFGHGAEYKDTATEEEQKIHEKLRKDTANIADGHNDFFEELSKYQIKTIYSYGFSFSEVDQLYIRKIFENLNDTSDIIWSFNDFDSSRIEDFKEILEEECGFRGKYDTFSVIS